MKKNRCSIPIWRDSLRKLWIMTRFLFLFVFVASLHVSAALHSQNKMVTLHLEGVSLEEVIQSLKLQTDYGFFYNIDSKDIKKMTSISVDVKNMALEDVLSQILRGTNLSYTIVNDVVILNARSAVVVNDSLGKNHMLVGRVLDMNKEPLPGVTVIVKGLTLGTSTDVNGRFSLTLPKMQNVSLLFSFIGMETQEVKYTGQDSIHVVLKEAAEQLDEVIVRTGYQNIDKRKLTSAVQTIKMDDIKVAGVNTIDQMLEGRIPGMIFMQNSGQVGAAPKLRIRGTSTVLGNREPLWVLDGVVLTDPVNVDPAQINDLDFVNLLGNAISGLNPNDIEQIDVLKDASATALYGAKAGNGVIVITTKKGKAGPPSVTYSGTGSFTRRPRYSDRAIYLMNSKERVDVSRELVERGVYYNNVDS